MANGNPRLSRILNVLLLHLASQPSGASDPLPRRMERRSFRRQALPRWDDWTKMRPGALTNQESRRGLPDRNRDVALRSSARHFRR
jgi:hypothetical protein